MTEKLETMSYEDILAQMEEFLVIDPMSRDLDQISLRTGRAYMKAQTHYIREARYLEYLMSQQRVLDLHLRRYYAGELPQDAYAKRPLRVRVLKTEVDSWLKADELFIEMSALYNEQKLKVKMIEGLMDRITRMGYEVKNAIEWRKYMDGC